MEVSNNSRAAIVALTKAISELKTAQKECTELIDFGLHARRNDLAPLQGISEPNVWDRCEEMLIEMGEQITYLKRIAQVNARITDLTLRLNAAVSHFNKQSGNTLTIGLDFPIDHSLKFIALAESISRNRSALVTLTWQAFPALKLLQLFALFCSAQNRDDIEMCCADLKRDAKQMQRKQLREPFIQAVILWRAITGTMIPILWDRFTRLLVAIFPVAAVIAKIKSMFH